MRIAPAVLATVVLVSSIAVSSPAAAQNLGFLGQSPVAFFNDDDWELLKDAVDKVLNDPEDYNEVQWDNPETHARGTVESLRTTQSGDRTCRRLRIHIHAQSRTSRGLHHFCHEGDGQWDFAKR